jgi:hypothetical protein
MKGYILPNIFIFFFYAQKTKAKGDEASVVDGREGADLLPEDFEWFGKSIREMAHRYNFFFQIRLRWNESRRGWLSGIVCLLNPSSCCGTHVLTPSQLQGVRKAR